MANFQTAFSKILKSEGGISNDPDDSGGFTAFGISRNNWPGWAGWKLIDKGIRTGFELESSVKIFYKSNFWDKIGGDNLKNQNIANLLVDSAVNEGVTPAIKRAQGIVNLSQTGKVTPELITKLNLL